MKMSPDNLKKGYLRAWEKEAQRDPFDATIKFLDDVNSLKELMELETVMKQKGEKEWFDFYKKNLIRWENPELSEEVISQCPLLTKRLDTTQKIRIFLRGADFRDVKPIAMGKVLEEIIFLHEIKEQEIVHYNDYRGDGERTQALRLVYHSQIQAGSLRDIAFGGFVAHKHGTGGLWLSWKKGKDPFD